MLNRMLAITGYISACVKGLAGISEEVDEKGRGVYLQERELGDRMVPERSSGCSCKAGPTSRKGWRPNPNPTEVLRPKRLLRTADYKAWET